MSGSGPGTSCSPPTTPGTERSCKSITTYNTNDYWELVRHESGLPWESSVYVPKILAAAIVGNNPGAFGLGRRRARCLPSPTKRSRCLAGTALAVVARAAGTKPEVLEALNPYLVREPHTAHCGAARVRLPPGTRAAYAESFDKTRGTGDKLETVVL